MTSPATTAEILLWGTTIGAVTWEPNQELGYFQYDPNFLNFGIHPAPLKMPLRPIPFSFPALNKGTFKGLPGMLADVLPDRFGNRLIDTWLAQQGRTPDSFNPVERLCYVGTRGMGALEFKPALSDTNTPQTLVVDDLVRLANTVLDERTDLVGRFDDGHEQDALDDILRVGTSAGGARAKAVLAWNPETNEFRSGQVEADKGFEHWLLKFDGVDNNRDKEVADPMGFGLIEYAYFRMAQQAGIAMMPCRLFRENGRSHFMTKRFDRFVRDDDGEIDKLHMQSLCAMQHFDFNDPTGYSYEQALLTINQLGLSRTALEEQFRRAVFNVVTRNQDDHVKNIAFLMDRSGNWHLSPAFDVTFAYNPSGAWTNQHQMSLNGKRKGFELADFLALAKTAEIKTRRAKDIILQVHEAVNLWPEIAEEVGISERWASQIKNVHRLVL